MREITQLQITAARYANPLTLLPGNVPIHEQMDQLLHCKTRFVVAYFDLDHFKPFNDVHGYLRGDELIAWTADILRMHSTGANDFLGHVGGDDFVMLLNSSQWEQQCLEILAAFQDGVGQFFQDEARSLGGYEAEDRQGHRVFHPLVSLSIGVVQVGPGVFTSHQELSAAAAISKHEAKKIPGNSLFIERRMPPPRKE
jgi:diguanylate cyclase (GGDEF)-like protein